jgi:glycine/D-amino acid oxidase-like deaminating enzyme
MKKKRAPAIRRRFPDVAVIGAGAFGGWTALHLLRLGARVTLIDAWGAGHARGTSSDHSRILRCGYGAHEIHSRWAWRALKLWKEFEREQSVRVFVNCGVLWLAREEDDYTRASLASLARLKIPVQRISSVELLRRYPQLHAEDVRAVYFEPKAGYLRARNATVSVANAVARHPRARLMQAQASSSLIPKPNPLTPSLARSPRLEKLSLSDGSALSAGAYVFACGPWLPQLFPDLLGARILVTKQEVFYFGTPPADPRFTPAQLPAWIEVSVPFYGIPAADGCGLKVADDTSTTPFDPTHGDRTPAPERIESARRYLASRFPALANAPLVEAKVCQYERTPNRHLVIDRHPQFDNVWVAGGGSGHGFKLGPAVGEFTAHLILGTPCPALGLVHPHGSQNLREAVPAELRIGAIAFPDAADLSRLRSI